MIWNVRYYIDPETGLPHIYNHSVTEEEVEEVLARPGEDRQGYEGARLAIGQTGAEMMHRHFPPGWDEERVRRVLAHYETQTEEEAVAEDERAFEETGRAVIEIPIELMPVIREVLAQYQARVRA